MADHSDMQAGAVSGLAAGILVIALTVMALFAFQPQQAARMRAVFDTATVSAPNP